MSHYDILRRGYKQMAEEIATYAEAYDSEGVRVDYLARTGPRDYHTDNWGHRHHGHRVDNFRRDDNKDQNSNRRCYRCQKIGHISHDCPNKEIQLLAGIGGSRVIGRAS
jgi:hypothetical protein